MCCQPSVMCCHSLVMCCQPSIMCFQPLVMCCQRPFMCCQPSVMCCHPSVMLPALGHMSSALGHVVSPTSQRHNRLTNQHSSRNNNNNNNNNQISTHILFVCSLISASLVPSRVTQAKTTQFGKETLKQEQRTNKEPKNRSKPNTVLHKNE